MTVTLYPWACIAPMAPWFSIALIGLHWPMEPWFYIESMGLLMWLVSREPKLFGKQ